MLSEHVTGVLEHKKQVAFLLHAVSTELNQRAIVHDDSKFSLEELEAFEEVTPRLKRTEYASDAYKQATSELGTALEHHYQVNRHHPQHFSEGINGMNLIDLVEMVCDWIAATRRVKNGDVYKSLPINQERFHMSDQLLSIIKNTIDTLLECEKKGA